MCVTINNNNSLFLLLHGFLLSVFILKITADPIPNTDQDAPKCNNNHGTCKVITDCNEIYSKFSSISDSINYCDKMNYIVCCPNPTKPIAVDSQSKFERECKKFSITRGQCPTTPFIVNGEKAKPKQFPFMALIGLRDTNTNKVQWICGGTLISRNFVLTAAHCLISNYRNPEFHIRLGELDYDITTDDAQPQDFVAINYIIHPDYENTINQHNDIALLQLKKNAELNEYVMPACLTSITGNEFNQLTTAGWGQTKDAGPSSSHLMAVTLNSFDDNVCTERLPDFRIDVRTQLCAGSFTSTSDTCQGDSGGPIFTTHPTFYCMRLVVGITSFGITCGNRNLPSVYTRVDLYLDWIEKIVWGL